MGCGQDGNFEKMGGHTGEKRENFGVLEVVEHKIIPGFVNLETEIANIFILSAFRVFDCCFYMEEDIEIVREFTSEPANKSQQNPYTVSIIHFRFISLTGESTV